MTGAPVLRTAHGADLWSPSRGAVDLVNVAEQVAARSDFPKSSKVRILLAILRALSTRRICNIESIDNVTRLMLHDPDEFERLLRSYWLLLGTQRTAA